MRTDRPAGTPADGLRAPTMPLRSSAMPEPASADPRRATPRGNGCTLSRLGEAGGGLLVYSGLTFLFLWPFHRVWRDHLAPDRGDPLFNIYILEWVGRQIQLGFPDLLGANFFFPLENALTLSDHLLGVAFQSLVLDTLHSGGAIATYNLLVFLSFPLSGLGAAGLARACGCSRIGSLVAGAVYAFAPYHWGQLSHLQVLSYQWIPPTLWAFDRLLATPRPAKAGLFLAAYTLHVTGGSYLAYMVHVPLLILLMHRAFTEPGWRSLAAPSALRVLLPAAGVASAVTLGVFLPYLRSAGPLGLEWGAENYRIFGATLPSLLTPAPLNRHFELLAPALSRVGPYYEGDYWFAEKSLFLGFVPSALLVVGAAQRLRGRIGLLRPSAAMAAVAAVAATLFAAIDLFTLGRWPAGTPELLQRPGAVYTIGGTAFLGCLVVGAALRRRAGSRPAPLPPAPDRDLLERGLLLAGGASFLLCFPIVFEPLSEIVPGLSSMRVPARFFPFALLAAALLCARGTDVAASTPSTSRARPLIGLALLALLVAELAPRPIPWHALPRRNELPEVYGWLAERPEVEAILELPFLPPPDEVQYMYRSTVHWKPIVNGYSGHFPTHYAELTSTCCWPVPDDRSLTLLRSWGVSHLVVHPLWQKRWQQRAYAEWKQAVDRGEVAAVQRVFLDPATGDEVFDIRGGDVAVPRPMPGPAGATR